MPSFFSKPFKPFTLSAILAISGLSGCDDNTSLDSHSKNSEQSTVNMKSDNFTFGNVEFLKNEQWHQVSDVTINAEQQIFTTQAGEGVLINRPQGDLLGKSNWLFSANDDYQDMHLKVDFNVTKSAESAIYFLGRYRLNISDIYGKKQWWQVWMGGIHARFDDEREWKNFDGITASANGNKPAGEWQTLTVDFKAPRFDENGFKTEYAQYINVKVNGVTVQQNQVGTGPAKWAFKKNDSTTGPLIFVGDTGPIAFRNLTVEKKDFSSVPAPKKVKEAEKTPLGEKLGQPMFNVVELGKKTFLNKGCKECHEVNPSANSVKTGPKLYGIFEKEAKNISVFDSSEQHNTSILADEYYLAQSIRKSTLHLAIRTQSDGSDKTFLPIMPSYNSDAISDSEITGLLAYLRSLNTENKKGPSYIWQEAPEKPYVLNEDLTAELVSDTPRLARVNIGSKASGRAYHVGLPNQMNYTFDPRTLAFEMVWSGRFLSLKNEKQGRADSPSTVGRDAKIWADESLSHLFQPVLSNGEKVDFTFKEPAQLTAKLANEFLSTKIDFNDELTKFDAEFIGVDTPINEVPSFKYRVNNNAISVNLTVDNQAIISAKFTFDNKQPLKLSLANSKLSNIKVSVGNVIQEKKAHYWVIPAGEFTNATFSAQVLGTPEFVQHDDNIVSQENTKQALVWSPSINKKQTLPNGYVLENALEPNDKFGRKVLFEPLGIAFTKAGSTYVSTRTAGVWKITDNKWQQFSEGVFDSLGLVVDDENTIVVGEKPSLTRFFDTDNNGWADKREVVSDKFRFNSNYHEYLHGPIKLNDGSYIYNLNLGHSVPGGYGNGGAMTTAGGYRGWAMKVDPQGNTTTFAYGLRSPAGIGLHKSGTIYYTDNQGDFQGTSKLSVLKPNTYYGHPAGLVDLPKMTAKSPEVDWKMMKSQRDLAVGLLPHSRAINSPGSPVWDETGGNFGPYQGQMFIGDQTQSSIYRVQTQTVNGVEQSSLLPFMAVTSSGVLRLTFSPVDHSLWIGQTGRGWWAKGGNISGLQRIVWDGKTIPQSIHSIEAHPAGYKVNFTQPVAESIRTSFDKLKVSSWYYEEDFNYGSAEKEYREEKTDKLTWADNGKSVTFNLANFSVNKDKPATHTSRVYEIDLTATEFAKKLKPFHKKAWYTLNAIPQKM